MHPPVQCPSIKHRILVGLIINFAGVKEAKTIDAPDQPTYGIVKKNRKGWLVVSFSQLLGKHSYITYLIITS